MLSVVDDPWLWSDLDAVVDQMAVLSPSQRPPDHLLAVVEAFRVIEGEFSDHYAEWETWAKTPAGASAPRLESNQVLAKVGPQLEAAGYAVEKTGAKLHLTVLWG